MSSAGTKVTKGAPEQTEPTGEVLKDSLAGESLQSGGAFASNNPHAGVSPQTAKGTTANNTDTSGAHTLEAAQSAGVRDAAKGYDENAELSKGSSKTEGVGPTYSEATGSSGTDSHGSKPYNTRTGGTNQGGTAPSYVAADAASQADGKPKGANLKEGGFDSDAKNASFDSDIGDKNDPGRLAENKFAAASGVGGANTMGSVSGNASTRQTGVTNDGQYDALKETEA